jgi:hypothetical protein
MVEPMPAGTEAIVETAIEDAPQSLFTAADVPLASVDELLAALQGPAVKALFEARIRHIVKHGHTSEHDDELPIGYLARKSHSILGMSFDLIDGISERRDLERAKHRIADALAVGLAGLDRLERATRGKRS